MTLKLTNCLSKKVYFFDNLIENSYSSDLFYCFDIFLEPNMADGEYSFILYDDGNPVANGLCQIGDYVPNNTRYNNEDNENGYTVYEG